MCPEDEMQSWDYISQEITNSSAGTGETPSRLSKCEQVSRVGGPAGLAWSGSASTSVAPLVGGHLNCQLPYAVYFRGLLQRPISCDSWYNLTPAFSCSKTKYSVMSCVYCPDLCLVCLVVWKTTSASLNSWTHCHSQGCGLFLLEILIDLITFGSVLILSCSSYSCCSRYHGDSFRIGHGLSSVSTWKLFHQSIREVFSGTCEPELWSWGLRICWIDFAVSPKLLLVSASNALLFCGA